MKNLESRPTTINTLKRKFEKNMGTSQKVDWLTHEQGEIVKREIFGEILEVNDTHVLVKTPDQDEMKISLREIKHYWEVVFADIEVNIYRRRNGKIIVAYDREALKGDK